MSPQEEGDANRATVALVYGAVRDVKELTRAGFVDVQRQIDTLAGLPPAVSRLHERVAILEERAATLKAAADAAAARVQKAADDRAGEVAEAAEERALEQAERDREQRSYRRIHMPAIALGIGGLALAIANRVFGV